MNTDNRKFDIDDYIDEPTRPNTGEVHIPPRRRSNLPPIKNNELDLINSTDPIVQKLLKKMNYERFMEEELDINVRFEAYKKKIYGV